MSRKRYRDHIRERLTCTNCKEQIALGIQMVRTGFGFRHLKCPEEPLKPSDGLIAILELVNHLGRCLNCMDAHDCRDRLKWLHRVRRTAGREIKDRNFWYRAELTLEGLQFSKHFQIRTQEYLSQARRYREEGT